MTTEPIMGIATASLEDAEKVALKLSKDWPKATIYVFQSTSVANKFWVDVLDLTYSDEKKICEYKNGVRNGQA